MKSQDYEVLSPLKHDGDEVEVGQTVSLSKKDAAPLLACGAIRDPRAVDVEVVVEAEATREEQIVEGVKAMMAEDPEKGQAALWTKAGKPEVKAIEKMVGFDITAAERDAAWDAAIAEAAA